MSELALNLLRLGFLGLLWLFVLLAIGVLRRDLKAPRDARPAAVAKPAKPAKAPKAPKPGPAKAKVKGSALSVTEGALAGTVIPLGASPITLGRAADSTIVIEDDYASNRHARIYPAEGRWYVEDLGSTNGTWLDRSRITAPTQLPVGVPLRVGRTTLVLQK